MVTLSVLVWAFYTTHTKALASAIALFLLTTMYFTAMVWLVGFSACVEDLLKHAARPSNLFLFNCVELCFGWRLTRLHESRSRPSHGLYTTGTLNQKLAKLFLARTTKTVKLKRQGITPVHNARASPAYLELPLPNSTATERTNVEGNEEAENQHQRLRTWSYHRHVPDAAVNKKSKLTEAAKLLSAEEMQRLNEDIFNPLDICWIMKYR